MSVVHHKYPTSAKIKVIHASKIFPISYLQCAVISVAILGPDLFSKKFPSLLKTRIQPIVWIAVES